jgi:hypothetical protein
MKKFSNLIELQEDGTVPCVEIFKKTFSIPKIKQKKDLHIFYNAVDERGKVTVIHGTNKLIIYNNWTLFGEGSEFNEENAKKTLNKFLHS